MSPVTSHEHVFSPTHEHEHGSFPTTSASSPPRPTIASFLRIHEHGFSDFILINAPVTQKDRLSERRRIVKIAEYSTSHHLSVSKPPTKRPVCIVIAGPNGAGKTTFAREFLPKDTGVVHFVNADLIASGLSPLRPELAALAAGRLFLKQLDRLAKARLDFAFESTLSGLVYLSRLKRWKAAGYRIEIVYLRLSSPHRRASETGRA
jgi:hypothetical protein